MILPNIGILPLFFDNKNSDLILPNIGILILFFQTFDFTYLIVPNIGILFSSVRTLEFLCYPFQTLEFWSYSSNHWNFYPILPNIWILILSFRIIIRIFLISQCSTFRKKSWGQVAPKFSFLVARTSILVAKNHI